MAGEEDAGGAGFRQSATLGNGEGKKSSAGRKWHRQSSSGTQEVYRSPVELLKTLRSSFRGVQIKSEDNGS